MEYQSESEPPLMRIYQSNVHFLFTQGELVVEIGTNGDVWVNPKYETTEAARIFWNAMRQLAVEEKQEIAKAVENEREACARAAETFTAGHALNNMFDHDSYDDAFLKGGKAAAELIRARGKIDATIHSQPPPQGE